MKNKIKKLTGALLALLLSGSIYAQNNPTHDNTMDVQNSGATQAPAVHPPAQQNTMDVTLVPGSTTKPAPSSNTLSTGSITDPSRVAPANNSHQAPVSAEQRNTSANPYVAPVGKEADRTMAAPTQPKHIGATPYVAPTGKEAKGNKQTIHARHTGSTPYVNKNDNSLHK